MAPGAYSQGIMLSVAMAFLPGLAWNGVLGLAVSKEIGDAKHIGGGILYVLFALSSLVAPSIVNMFGARLSLFIGGSTYALVCFALLLAGGYSFLPVWVVTVCMALVGLGAGILWTAQGMLTLSYPTAAEKGKYQTTFWVFLNLGTCLLGIYTWAVDRNGHAEVSMAVWWLMAIFSCIGLVTITFLAPLDKVVRSDGVMCQAPEVKPLAEELNGMLKVIMDKRVIALFPLFMYSNWFYSYELTSFSVIFDAGASGLTSAIFWGSQMLGAKSLDAILVYGNMNVRTRAFVSITFCFVLIAISWVWGAFANSYYHADDAENPGFVKLAWNDAEMPQAYALMALWGFCDALVQNWVYWIVAQLYTDPADMSRMIGVYKSLQSLASSISFFIGTSLVPSGQLWLIIAIFLTTIPGAYYLCNTIKSASPEDVEKLVAK